MKRVESSPHTAGTEQSGISFDEGLLHPDTQIDVSIDQQADERPPASVTPGSIAAKYCDFLHECYPLPKEDGLRDGQIAQVVQYLQKEGKVGVSQLRLAVKGLATSFADNSAVQELAKLLTEDLSQYQRSAPVRKPKRQRKVSRER